jgi:hypothetical protein
MDYTFVAVTFSVVSMAAIPMVRGDDRRAELTGELCDIESFMIHSELS